MTTRGRLAIVLHTHLPYCRMAGRWPHGEEWFHQAMVDCYLPLVGALRRLANEAPGSTGITVSVTPILAEQLRDPLMKEHFSEYLADWIRRAEKDVARFEATVDPRLTTARFHASRLRSMRSLYEDEIGRDVTGALARLEETGEIEVGTSAATHGYLPLLADERAVAFQIATGMQSHRRNFERAARSFWMPECAYEPGLESQLERAGVKATFVETHLVAGQESEEAVAPVAYGSVEQPRSPGAGTTFSPYRIGRSNVTVLARNRRTGQQVWSAEEGYPGDGAYREFHKKDDESGLHYWRVTGPRVDLGAKQLYDPVAAANLARAHAKHWADLVEEELASGRSVTDAPILMASYDTELFGHWWFEGVGWLEAVVRELRSRGTVELTTPGAIAARPPARSIEMPAGSWGNGGDNRTWVNEATAWTWPEIHSRQERAAALMTETTAATRQLARELLLLQASDWQFLITTGQAGEYATQRFQEHCARFDRLADSIQAGDALATEALAVELGRLDNPFPAIDPGAYVGRPA